MWYQLNSNMKIYMNGGFLKANKSLLDFPKFGLQVFCHVYSYYYIAYLSWTYFYFITNQEKNISVHQEFVSHIKQLLKLCYERIVNLIIHYNIKRITPYFTLKSLSWYHIVNQPRWYYIPNLVTFKGFFVD